MSRSTPISQLQMQPQMMPQSMPVQMPPPQMAQPAIPQAIAERYAPEMIADDRLFII